MWVPSSRSCGEAEPQRVRPDALGNVGGLRRFDNIVNPERPTSEAASSNGRMTVRAFSVLDFPGKTDRN